MSDDVSALGRGGLRLPSSGHEFWALALSVVIVFVLVQVGAPIIRNFEVLDPKLRDYFIGMSFAAFPLIHNSCKRNLSRFRTSSEPVLHDSSPWYVAGIVAGAILFAWNQFVSAITGFALVVMQGAFPDPTSINVTLEDVANIQTAAALIVILPIGAAASLLAGLQLNRHTRSHVIAAVGIAAVFFVVANSMVTWAMHPELMMSILAMIVEGGATGAQVLFGMSLVGLVVFGFGSIGVFISRMYQERPLGKIIEAARKLPVEQREALAVELNRRIHMGQRGEVAIETAMKPSPPQLATNAEP